jgi:hypothetical protein
MSLCSSCKTATTTICASWPATRAVALVAVVALGSGLDGTWGTRVCLAWPCLGVRGLTKRGAGPGALVRTTATTAELQQQIVRGLVGSNDPAAPLPAYDAPYAECAALSQAKRPPLTPVPTHMHMHTHPYIYTHAPVGADGRAACTNLVAFLTVDKGKRIVRRALPRLTEVQRVGLFATLVRVLDRLDVVATPMRAQVALFLESVMAPVGALLSRLPFDNLPGSLNAMLSATHLFGLFSIAISKVRTRGIRHHFDSCVGIRAPVWVVKRPLGMLVPCCVSVGVHVRGSE